MIYTLRKMCTRKSTGKLSLALSSTTHEKKKKVYRTSGDVDFRSKNVRWSTTNTTYSFRFLLQERENLERKSMKICSL